VLAAVFFTWPSIGDGVVAIMTLYKIATVAAFVFAGWVFVPAAIFVVHAGLTILFHQ
jgi:hypothetical protein